MRRTYTILPALLLALTLSGFYAQTASAQAQPLGDEFIFFVEGLNPAVPNSSANIVTDPTDPENRVLAFSGGNFANPALTWPATEGVDITENRANDSLFMRIRIGPGVGTPESHANVYFMLLDTEDLSTGDLATDDVAFRAIWPVPDSLFDGEWHDLAIPFPPATIEGIEAVDSSANPLVVNWAYQGGYHPPTNSFVEPSWEDFQDFGWDAVQSFGFFWDQGSGPGGTIYVDDWYIGSENTDLSGFEGAGPAYAGTVTLTPTEDSAVNISFSAQEDAARYNVYVVTGVDADVSDASQAQLVASISADAEALEATYRVRSPHPSIPNPSVTFAVTSQNDAGIENTTAVYSTTVVEDARPQGFFYQMSEDEVNGLFDAFSSQDLNVDFLQLEGVTPFRMGPEHGTVADEGRITTEENLYIELYGGWAPDPEDENETIIMIYADVTDDELYFAPDDGEGAPDAPEPWMFDRFAFFIGPYEVPFPIGSPNVGFETDIALNFQPVADQSGNITVNPSGAASDLFSTPIFEYKEGNTGFRMLAAFTVSDLDPELDLPLPGLDEIVYMPVIFGYDEQDGPGGNATRTSLVSSEQTNVNFAGPGWYNSPLQWPATAFVGANVGTSSETGDLPETFALGQNYPNPFNPSTKIQFSLAESGTVSLEVFNVLGQRVAVLVDGAEYAAGKHAVDFDAAGLSSGLYLYRITSGRHTATRQMMLVK